MLCPDDDSFAALLAGALPETEREAIVVHASSCESCHAVLDCLAPTASDSDDEAEDRLILKPGIKIGRFTIAERLGVGGMGIVHAAIDDELERRVALKLLRPGRGGSNARARLVREARTLARLSHPNIVTVFDVGEQGGNVYLVMELVEGGSILAWCRRGARTGVEIVEAMLEAGRGLAAAHAAGFIHRDVKPDNIMVGRDGRVRVTDFGLARPGETDLDPSVPVISGADLTKTGTLLGTPAYMAPEAMLGETSELADQWGFCATLYELLAGVRPFPVDTDRRAAAIEAGTLEPGRVLPPHVGPILSRGLLADPRARWPSMTALVTALSDALGRKRRRRRMVGLAIGVACILGASAAIAIVAWPTPPEAPPPPPMSYADPREGCSCPYSACANGCVAVCSAPAFRVGDKVPGISLPGRQEALVGISADGETILYLAGRQCALDRLYVARKRGEVYVSTDLTGQLEAHAVGIRELCCTLSADGTTVIVSTADQHRLLQARLDGDHLGPVTTLFAPELPSATAYLRAPVLSSDRKTLYYLIQDPVETDQPGLYTGVFVAEREDLDQPFTRNRRFAAPQRRYEVVSGESSDGLSLFMTTEYATRVLVRKTKSEPYGDPAPWLAPAGLWGWRAIPLGDCRRVAVTYSQGGCEQEDIRFLEAEDRAPGPPPDDKPRN